MKVFLFILSLLPVMAFAKTVKFSFDNEEVTKIIDVYSKASGQKFIVDPGVRGKATITATDNVSVEEAFNLLSSSLAVNGYAISKQGDTMVVGNARTIQRNLIETSTTLPALKPERMATYIITLQHLPVSMVNREVRILPSKDGEMNPFPAGNKIVITDWVSNLHRIDAVLKELDRPVDPKLAKIIAEGRKTMPPMHPPTHGKGPGKKGPHAPPAPAQ